MTDILEQLIGMLRNEQRRDERCRDVRLREPLLVMLAQRDQREPRPWPTAGRLRPGC